METRHTNKCNLDNEEILRYSRQLILPEIGVTGQEKLKSAKVLIVGVGGLGCPAALYLAAAGIGSIGLLDYDDVDKSNLHRQILHNEDTVGISKVTSAAQYIKRLNSTVNCIEHREILDNSTAHSIIQKYDVVVDASDNVATRYLVSDACVLAGKPLVSGSALRFEGQLTTYHYEDGPCYRCLYPNPPPPETVTNCSDGGVLGAVTGMIGSLQALETIKILTGMEPSYSKRLLMFDGLSGDIRVVRLRGKKPDCVVCGKEPTVKSLQDYQEFCGASATDKCQVLSILAPCDRISAEKYKSILDRNEDHQLIDVRPEVEFSICSLETADNFPISRFSDENQLDSLAKKCLQKPKPVYVICRQGNDSQKAVEQLRRHLQTQTNPSNLVIKDIIGGLVAWNAKVDSTFPLY